MKYLYINDKLEGSSVPLPDIDRYLVYPVTKHTLTPILGRDRVNKGPYYMRNEAILIARALTVAAGLAPLGAECDQPPVRSHLPINPEPRPDRTIICRKTWRMWIRRGELHTNFFGNQKRSHFEGL